MLLTGEQLISIRSCCFCDWVSWMLRFFFMLSVPSLTLAYVILWLTSPHNVSFTCSHMLLVNRSFTFATLHLVTRLYLSVHLYCDVVVISVVFIPGEILLRNSGHASNQSSQWYSNVVVNAWWIVSPAGKNFVAISVAQQVIWSAVQRTHTWLVEL